MLANIGYVGRIVYSCKSVHTAAISARILQVYKNARRNGRAFLWELMSLLMTKGTLVDIDTRRPGIRVLFLHRYLGNNHLRAMIAYERPLYTGYLFNIQNVL